MATSFKRSCACIATFSISDLAAGHCQSTPLLKLLGTHRQVWVSLLWGHCPFLLGLGAHKILFVPSKSLFPHSCVSSGGSIVGLMATSSKSAPGLWHPVFLPLWQATSTGDTETLKVMSGSVSVGSPAAHKFLFDPSEYLWQA